jgi:hypothetical protein
MMQRYKGEVMKPKPTKEELKKKATALKLKLKRAAAALEQHRLESEAAAQEAAELEEALELSSPGSSP